MQRAALRVALQIVVPRALLGLLLPGNLPAAEFVEGHMLEMRWRVEWRGDTEQRRWVAQADTTSGRRGAWAGAAPRACPLGREQRRGSTKTARDTRLTGGCRTGTTAAQHASRTRRGRGQMRH